MTEETIIEGTYLGERTKTTFNPKTQKVEQFITPIKVFIERANIVGQYECQSTDAENRGGTARSSNETSVMGVERRGSPVQF